MGQFVFLMLASHEIFTLFLFNYESHGQEEASSTYFDFAFKALVLLLLLLQLQCVISICNAFLKVMFLTNILCSVLFCRICEVWRLSSRGLSHIWLQVTEESRKV
jgi:hypothetical protein